MSLNLLSYIEKNNLISPGDNLLIAVSGGSDSMGLFSFLLEHKEKLQVKTISVCHLNHSLREEADSDQELVENYCREKGVLCTVKKVDVSAYAKANKLSIETAAREVRYQFFEEEAKRQRAKIVTAHNLNDNLETALFHFTRGLSLKGICAISNKRGNVIRPLLNTTKEEIDNYCKDKKIPVAIDKTNFQANYTRNKLRLQVVPKLEEINPNLLESFGSRVGTLQQEEDFLNQEAQRQFRLALAEQKPPVLNLKKMQGLHPAIYKRILVLFCKQLNKTPTQVEMNKLQEEINKKENKNLLQLSENRFLVLENDKVYEKLITKREQEEIISYKIPILDGEIFENEAMGIEVFVYDRENFEKKIKFNKNLLKNAVDYDTLSKGAFLRNKQDGDKFTLSERNVSKTLKKLFVEDKIDKSLRGRIPVLESGGKLVWVYGYGSIPQVAVSKTTKRVAVFYCRGI